MKYSKPKKTKKKVKGCKKPSDLIWNIYERICKEHRTIAGSEMSVDYQYLPHAIITYLDSLPLKAKKKTK